MAKKSRTDDLREHERPGSGRGKNGERERDWGGGGGGGSGRRGEQNNWICHQMHEIDLTPLSTVPCQWYYLRNDLLQAAFRSPDHALLAFAFDLTCATLFPRPLTPVMTGAYVRASRKAPFLSSEDDLKSSRRPHVPWQLFKLKK